MKNNSLSKKAILTALFAALISAGCYIQIPLPGGIPIVIQDMMSMLSGLILGPLYGTISVFLFLILGSLGLPVFSGKGGINVILQGPTGGFLIGYMAAAFAGGLIVHFLVKDKPVIIEKEDGTTELQPVSSKRNIVNWIFIAAGAITATVVAFTLGIIGFHRVKPDLAMSKVLAAVLIPFIPGNTIKLIIMIPLAKKVQYRLNSRFLTISSAILKINNVTRRFPNGTTALNNVTFSINEGEFAVICGRNGSGKSVLMSLIAQLDEPDSGTIEVPRNSVGLVFQDADAQILGETPEEDVAFGLKNNNVNLTVLRNKTEQTLKECGLYEKRCFPARQMSGGEKRRLAVAGILAMERNIIIFDEPFANLDYPGVLQVSSILKNLKQQGKTVIVLTHELEKILGLADRFIILDKSCIQYDGTPCDGLTLNLEEFGIRNPLATYKSAEDLFWGAK